MYNNFKSKESMSELPDFMMLSFWEKNSNYDYKTIFNLVKYIRHYKSFFLGINKDNFNFIFNLVKKIVRSNFKLKLENYITTWRTINEGFGYKSVAYFTERGFSYQDYLDWNEYVNNNVSTSYEGFIKRYGYEEGSKKYNDFINKVSFANSLEGFIFRYGEELGEQKWNEYIEEQKYKSSYQYYIDRYGKEEGQWRWNEKHLNKKFYSQISQKLCWQLYNYLNDKDEIYFGEYNGEWFISIKNGGFYLVDFKYYNKVIEFNGDYWHRNPLKFESTPENEEIWYKDEIKNDAIRSKFDLLIVWEHDFINNPNETINKCLDFLNTNLYKENN